MNNFADYPITDSQFYKDTSVLQIKTTKVEGHNCLPTQGYIEPKIIPSSQFGYHKPLNEICPPVKSNLKEINEIGGLPWNNNTKRKTLVNI